MNHAGNFTWAAGYYSGRGLVRHKNEDAVAINGEPVSQEEVGRDFLDSRSDHLIVLADGMGGHVRGEFASQLTLTVLAAQWRRQGEAFEPLEATRAANGAVYDAMRENPELLGMGTTVVGLHIRQNTATWFNVGDSRLYLYRAGVLQQISVDHVPRGITAGGGRTHSITQSIGGSYRPLEIWPAMGTLELHRNDLLLACTDGLTDCVTDSQIAAACTELTPIENLVSQLVGTAEARGAPDNLSIVALRG